MPCPGRAIATRRIGPEGGGSAIVYPVSNFPDTLERALLSAARHHAAVAMRDRESPDFHARLGAAVAAGAAVELLLKYLLTLKQPLYLQELKPKDVKTAWRTRELLIGPSVSYDSSLCDVKSVSAFEAIEMTHALYADLKPAETDLRAALHARNAAIHLAVAPSRVLMEDAVYAVIMLFTFAHELDLIEDLPFEEQSEQVKWFVRTYREQRIDHVRKKLADAKDLPRDHLDLTRDELRNLREDVSFFLDSQRREIIGDEDESLFRGFAAYEMSKCPACKENATVVLELSGDVDVQEIDGRLQEVPVTVRSVYAFGCGTCGLKLSSTELNVLAASGDGWAARLCKDRVVSNF